MLELAREGLHMQDVDGDGQILSMRMVDAGGGWKVSDKDPRLMVPRRFDERGGIYYRIFPEGVIEDYDGVEVGVAPAQRGLDFNRNFGANWQPESVQAGAGEYPTPEPETRALAAFLAQHPKHLWGAVAAHRHGVDSTGRSVHEEGPRIWSAKIEAIAAAGA